MLQGEELLKQIYLLLRESKSNFFMTEVPLLKESKIVLKTNDYDISLTKYRFYAKFQSGC